MKAQIVKNLGLLSLVTTMGSAAMAATPVVAPIIGGNTIDTSNVIAKRTVGLFFISTDPTTHQQGLGICTGSILDNSRILTAAHCVENASGGLVIFSNNNLVENVNTVLHTGVSSVPVARMMSGVKQEPGFPGLANANNGGEFNDLAVVTFQGGLPAGYEPAKFLTAADAANLLKKNQTLTLSGYGMTAAPAEMQQKPKTSSAIAFTMAPDSSPQQNPDLKPSDFGAGVGVLREVDTKLAGIGPKHIDLVLKGKTGHIACEGDSGGPAMVVANGETYVVGVDSRGDCSTAALYTYVDASIVSSL